MAYPTYLTPQQLSFIHHGVECNVNVVQLESSKDWRGGLCIIQKLPHLLLTNVLYNYNTNETNNNFTHWDGPLASAINNIMTNFLKNNFQHQHTITPLTTDSTTRYH